MQRIHRYRVPSQVLFTAVLLTSCFNEGREAQYVDATPPHDAVSLCPPGMGYVPEFDVCIDRYEASRVNDVATSRAGEMPWHSLTFSDALQACKDVGKRLCSEEEWVGACKGPPPGTIYPYGNTYDPDVCGGLETTLPGGIHDSGSLTECEGGYPGIFDMSANVWEWSASCTDALCMARGGGELEGEMGARCDSSRALRFNDSEAARIVGFRCCMSLPAAE